MASCLTHPLLHHLLCSFPDSMNDTLRFTSTRIAKAGSMDARNGPEEVVQGQRLLIDWDEMEAYGSKVSPSFWALVALRGASC